MIVLIKKQAAFTRLDLLVTIGLVLSLGWWAVSAFSGESARISRCAGNLMFLGRAMHGYTGDNRDALPAGTIELEKAQSSWDTNLFPYLKPRLSGKADQLSAAARYFACPSDAASHEKTRRSYAMGGNDMAAADWPPGPGSGTGVGLRWNEQNVLSLLDKDALADPGSLPMVKLSDIPVPAETLLLTEFVGPDNILGGLSQTVVFGVSQQRQSFRDGGGNFHHGRFNYLMIDGHVESLSPLQTGSFDGSAGIWTMKKGN